jgi:hypothetical protein
MEWDPLDFTSPTPLDQFTRRERTQISFQWTLPRFDDYVLFNAYPGNDVSETSSYLASTQGVACFGNTAITIDSRYTFEDYVTVVATRPSDGAPLGSFIAYLAGLPQSRITVSNISSRIHTSDKNCSEIVC